MPQEDHGGTKEEEMKPYTRVDVFANLEEVEKFYAWAATKNPKTKEDMVRLLAEYKKPDMVVKMHKEHVEAKIEKQFRVRRAK